MSGRATIVVCLVFLISCSKSSDPAPSTTMAPAITAKDLVGNWLGSTVSVTGCTTSVNNSTEQPCTPYCRVYIFTETAVTYAGYAGGPAIGTYSISGDSINISFAGKGRIELQNNKLTLSYKTSGAGCINHSTFLKN